MLDFMIVSTRRDKRGVTEIFPKFTRLRPSEDLMIRGGSFYAIWVESKGMWSTNEQDVIDLVDKELDNYANENRERFEQSGYRVLHMWDCDSGSIDKWHKYCEKQMNDSFHPLDEQLVFSNTPTKRENYSSKRLDYPLQEGETKAWDRMVSVLYSPEERHKIEWSIGSIVCGDSKKLQKFLVFHGDRGTGKSTIIEIIEDMFDGYTATFDAKQLGNPNNRFALEAFKTNPLVAIQHDGDLSHIEDNSRLNSLVSHEKMSVEHKNKSLFDAAYKCFLIMGTNRPVKITDARSGLLRRLIDVSPTGEKLPGAEYNRLKKQIKFEHGAIAWRCLKVYEEDPHAYDDYVPVEMLGATNDFYNFVLDSWPVFQAQDSTTLKAAWLMYKVYCEDAKVSYPFSQRVFKEELKNYFKEFSERETDENGTRVRNLYKGFLADKFKTQKKEEKNKKDNLPEWLRLKGQSSPLDICLQDCPAQYATEDEKPSMKWADVKLSLKDIDTSRLHYVKVPEQHIVIDFDLVDDNGEKSLEKNLAEAAKWPETYAEVSKSGKGLHLHYIYDGDVKELSRVYGDRIEIKVFTGNSSLRRKLILCNTLAVAMLTAGLPKKEVKKKSNMLDMTNEQKVKGLITQIKNNLDKVYHAGTKPSIDFIKKILDDAYEDESLSYDVSSMRNAITAFAAGSTHHAEYCLKEVGKMHFMSKNFEEEILNQGPERFQSQMRPIVFYDVEVFPNLFLVCWKAEGEGKPVVKWFNPTPAQIEELCRNRLIGFNCRRYDNHILYARIMGYSNMQIYNLSKRIINTEKGKKNDYFFREAYNLSYTDIYDFANAGNKKSLKKLEIEMGIHHQELGFDWNKPVDEAKWDLVAGYCENDVLATEKAFTYLKADWTARQILADLAGLSVNDTTNSLTTKIIFGQMRKPQDEFEYRNLAEPVKELKDEVKKFLLDACPEMMSELHGDEDSLLPYFPNYWFGPAKDVTDIPDVGKTGYVSIYKGEVVGEGGYVYAEPGRYDNVALLDIASMHPHSIIAECLFGPRFTRVFRQIVEGRVSIKHKAWDECNDILDGKLRPYIAKVQAGEMTAKDLANGLKTAINSVYGLTSAAFENAFRDPRNKDNIVAKRGALFMVDLKNAVQKMGYKVAHIKTDSIKIPNADKEIIRFVKNMGKRYGYSFEHEATYSRMCLVNDAVYVAKYASVKDCESLYGCIPDENNDHEGEWTATGKQFAVPYVFKKLFTRQEIEFPDMCETFSVSGELYLDMNEMLPNVEEEEKILQKTLKKLEMSWEDYQDFLAGAKQIDIQDERNLREIQELIDKGHDYHFVGRVGEFCPMQHGGELMRYADGKYSAATGSKGYRWMESEMVRTLNKENEIDRTYYERLASDAIETIEQFTNFDEFVGK